jgi:AAA family ATP:ADP antiporter
MIAGRLRLVDVRPGEREPTIAAALGFCALLAGYFVMRPVRDALALDGDPRTIPVLFTATFVSTLVLAPAWGALVARWPRRRVVPVAYLAFAAQLLGLWAVLAAGAGGAWIGRVFYVWTSVFNLFVVSAFWSVVTDAFTPEQGRRLFGVIAAGGTVGALIGPSLTSALVEDVGVDGMLLVSTALLGVATGCVRWLDAAAAARGPASAPDIDRGTGGSALAGLAHVARSPRLLGITSYVLCTSVAATFLYLQQAEIVKAGFATREARAAWFADVDLASNLVVLAVQTVITARLMGVAGVGVVLAVLPLAQAGGLVALALWPVVGAIAAVQIVGRTATHALTRPGRELLFTAVPREDRYKAKHVIDVLLYRFGDMATGWLYVGLLALGLGRPGLAAVFAPLGAAWLVCALLLGRAHARTAGATLKP